MASLRPVSRDFAALRSRRQQAARLFARGETLLASVAQRLQVSRQSVWRWYHQWKRSGVAALRGAGRAGRKPRLTAPQLERVKVALSQGARAHGFAADLWTLPRVARIIERLTGVRFHPGHVWKLLGSLDWTVQKPAQQAKERKPQKIAYWKRVSWPVLKKTLRG